MPCRARCDVYREMAELNYQKAIARSPELAEADEGDEEGG